MIIPNSRTVYLHIWISKVTSLSNHLLLKYRNTIDSCTLNLYFEMLLNSLTRSISFGGITWGFLHVWLRTLWKQFYYFFFSSGLIFLMQFHWLGPAVQCQIEVMRLHLCLALHLEDKAFNISKIDAFTKLKKFPSIPNLESFYYEWTLNIMRKFFCIYWHNHMGLFF